MRTEETVAAMPCPICGTGLVLSDRQGVEIDYCPTCREVWPNRGGAELAGRPRMIAALRRLAALHSAPHPDKMAAFAYRAAEAAG